MVPIPHGTRYYASVHGRLAVEVACESCRGPFVYVCERLVTASVLSPLDLMSERTARERAEAKAQRSLARKLQTPDLVACPKCGWFQMYMVRYAKRRRALRVSLLAAAVIFILAFFCVWLGQHNGVDPGKVFTAAAIIAAVSIGIVATWYVLSDPNANPSEPARQARMANSRGIPLERYRELEAEYLAGEDQRSGTSAPPQRARDGQDYTWLGRLQPRSDRRSVADSLRQRRRFDEQYYPARRAATRSMIVVILAVGIVAGIATVCGPPRWAPPLQRVALGLLLSPVFGWLVFQSLGQLGERSIVRGEAASAAGRVFETPSRDPWRTSAKITPPAMIVLCVVLTRLAASEQLIPALFTVTIFSAVGCLLTQRPRRPPRNRPPAEHASVDVA